MMDERGKCTVYHCGDHPDLTVMVHSCRIRHKPERWGMVTTQRGLIAKNKKMPCEMMPESREKHERKPNGIERHRHRHKTRGGMKGGTGMGKLRIGVWSADHHIREHVFFGFLALYLPFSSKLKFSHATHLERKSRNQPRL
jgi:hypothetical protein